MEPFSIRPIPPIVPNGNTEGGRVSIRLVPKLTPALVPEILGGRL